jgi:hypothetical protein
MTLDDELRAVLHGRAIVVPPSPDPLAGIERRAARMRRNRIGASVAGSVLAVAAVASVVPLLQGAASEPRPDGPPVASAEPSASASPEPTAVVASSPYALDPDRPWPYRGAPLEQLGPGTVDTLAREYAVKRGVAASSVELTPLWGQLYEPSGQAELVFLASVDGAHRWGVAQGGEAGPEFPVDEALPSPALALPVALPGDEGVGRLVVVAAPEVGEISYGPDGASEYAPMVELADGVAITALEGDPETDVYRALGRGGQEIVSAPAPDVPGAASPPDVGEGPGTEQPSPPPAGEQPVPGDEVPPPPDAVDWPVRGGLSAELQERALADFSSAAGVSRDEVGSRLLYAGQRGDRVYVLLQGWYGGDARTFGWSVDTVDGTTEQVLQGFTAPEPAVLAALFDEVLLVVPEPRAGQVLYAPEATAEPQPVPDQGTEAAVLIDRPDGTTTDSLLVLDGNGDPERPIYRGTVEQLLATTR